MGKSSTRNSRLINASPEKVYRAFTSAAALEAWLAPGAMIGKIHRFDLSINGGYEMSLFYPPGSGQLEGKTRAKEDRYSARFVELHPFKKIVESIRFDSANADFAEDMLMEVRFDALDDKTNVTIIFKNIPPAIDAADNEKGTALSLEKLARYVQSA